MGYASQNDSFLIQNGGNLMFDLKISDLFQADTISKHWATDVVSLVNPESSVQLPQPGLGVAHRCYYFHDVTEEDLKYFGPESVGYQLATPEQVTDLLEFTKRLTSESKLLVHCHAGISRSTATACGILCQHNLSPSVAIQRVLEVRPQALPNLYLIRLFDELLDMRGSLIEAVDTELERFHGRLYRELHQYFT